MDLGLLQIDLARLPEAEKTIRQSMTAIGKYYPFSGPRSARAASALVQVLYAHGEYKQAIGLFHAAIKIQSGYRAAKADLASSMDGLADSVFGMGEYLKAGEIYQSALELHKQLYGEHHPRIAGDIRNLGICKPSWDGTQRRSGYFVKPSLSISPGTARIIPKRRTC